MASSSKTKPQKKLGEYLNEQQEPFILELYLSERHHYSKGCSLNGDYFTKSSKKPLAKNSCSKRKKKRTMLRFPGVVLPTLYSKLGFHTEGINKHFGCVSENGFADIDEEGNSIWFHEDYNMFSSVTCRNSSLCNMGLQRQHQSCVEGEGSLVSIGKIPLGRAPYVTAVWSLLGQSVKKENCNMESQEILLVPNVTKRVVHKIKKLLCVSESEMTIAIPTTKEDTQCCKQSMGSLEIGKRVWEGTKKRGQQGGDGANLTNLLTLDYMDSIKEWRNFEPHLMMICFEITNAILDCICNEIVLGMIESMTNLTYELSSPRVSDSI